MKNIIVLFVFFLFSCNAFSQETNAPVNLGPTVNSEYSELRPLISPDGKTLYFIRESHPLNTKITNIRDCQDIWVSQVSGQKWGNAKHLTFPFNMENFNGIFSITPDGNTMLLRGAWKDDRFKGPGFSFSKKTKKGWSSFEQIEVMNFSSLNQGRFYGGYLTNDEQVLLMYFSESKDSKNSDLYFSKKNEDHSWSIPVMIKDSVSTSYDETAPFVAPDGKTLYFASDRPGGFGKHDIYKSTRLDDSWTKWSQPKNLGPSINTEAWEAHYSLDATGEYAYMVSLKNSIGKSDIIKVKLQEESKPNPVVLIYGKVLNAKTKKPLEATILYEILANGKVAGDAKSDPVDGSYKIILPYGKMYGFSAFVTGFISASDNIDLAKVASYQEIERDLYLSPIEVGQTVRMNNIFFEFAKATLDPESYPELDRVIKLMSDNPKMEIQISGHTDNVGSDEKNMTLSSDRAKAVMDYIVSKSILGERVKAKGYGETKPVGSNDTEDGKKMNRRVEFTILKK